MKTIVLTGPGEIGKRGESLKIRQQFTPDSLSILDFKAAGIKELQMQLSSPMLFVTGPRLLVVENIPDSLDLNALTASDENLTLLLLAASPRSDSPLLQSAKKTGAKILLFEGEREITAFPFLDALIERRKQALWELYKLLEQYGGMYVLSMIYYLLRRNLLPLPASDFMRKKINGQKQKYTASDWGLLYQSTLQTEYAIKSGAVTEQLGLVRLTEKIISGRY